MLQLNQKITDTTAKLNISKSELSRRLGKSRGYITEIQRIGCSTERQDELIAKIQMVADGSVYKSDEAIIAELEKKLNESRGWVEHNHKCAHKYLNTVHKKENELAELKDYIEDQERSHKEIREWNTEVDNTNKELRKNAQERAEHVLALQTNLSNHEYEIAELRETVSKQNSKIAFLNVILASANQNTEYQLSRLPTTAMAAFVLFIKMLFGGRA